MTLLLYSFCFSLSTENLGIHLHQTGITITLLSALTTPYFTTLGSQVASPGTKQRMSISMPITTA